jgi:MFS family permease
MSAGIAGALRARDHDTTEDSTTTMAPNSSVSRWADLSVRLAIALAFADASVAVLALPQIVVRLHTSISHVTWVITAYNLALIATTLAVLPLARRLASRQALVTGLAVFGLASLGSGAADSLTVLVLWRCVQGIGGGLLLCASLPLFARGGRAGTSLLHSWAATAAFGAGVGPTAGGILTQVFDWRAIFFAQAPVAAAAALTAVAGRVGNRGVAEPTEHVGAAEDAGMAEDAGRAEDAVALPPIIANLALALISAGLIGALFLGTILLINVWLLSPLGAALVLAVIPLVTMVTSRAVRDRPPTGTGAAGAVVLAIGLAILAFIPHREIGLALLALALCGGGLGLAFPALTRAALGTHGPPVARAARTVAAREGGLVFGLLLLTPILVSQLNGAPARATPAIVKSLIIAPISTPTAKTLGAGLLVANARAPESQLPDFGPAFTDAAKGTSPTTRTVLARLEKQINAIVQRAVTRSFRTPLLLCALIGLLALPLLAYGRRRSLALRDTPLPEQ